MTKEEKDEVSQVISSGWGKVFLALLIQTLVGAFGFGWFLSNLSGKVDTYMQITTIRIEQESKRNDAQDQRLAKIYNKATDGD